MKKYYRLTELDKAFDISVDDTHYLNSETDISFCLYCKTSDIILGGYKESKFFGFGKATYSGLIKLTKPQQTTIFESKKLSLVKSTILQKDKLTGYDSEYPFTVELPNKIFEGWLSAAFEKVPLATIPFYFQPEQRQSMLKQFCKGIFDISDNKEKLIEKASAVFDPSQPVPDELFPTSKIFTFDDICIEPDELERAKHYLFGNKEESASNTKLRPIDTMLINMLIEFPNDRPSKIWERLKDDLRNEPRKFDTDEIVDEVGKDTLYWFDDSAEIQQIKRKSFYNLVSRLKK
ncbi:hypothetical protein I6F66_00915 [Pseudoalteromonas sp. NZS100_1]|uniref:hypothetical protein n=1 Tax=Pseudoalteromonas sp. NZS100_1 TaxID=2792073 RepID=UPI0018CC7DAE|nr:hypothetical protein [Pseudoalteromonas sp. NZS100_1]MBH0010642.1 hypothetical protein [Pseudoalteromonas sp. NZS100_1]